MKKKLIYSKEIGNSFSFVLVSYSLCMEAHNYKIYPALSNFLIAIQSNFRDKERIIHGFI